MLAPARVSSRSATTRCAADLFYKRRRGEIDGCGLGGITKRGMIEIDDERNLESFKRLELGPFIALVQGDGFLDAHKPLWRGLLRDTGGLYQEHERTRAAVHNRDFGRRQFDIGVIDTQAGKRRHQMLDGGNLDTTRFECRGKAGIGNVIGAGAYFNRILEIDATKDDPGIDRGRPQGEVDFFACVESYAGGADNVFERSLINH